MKRFARGCICNLFKFRKGYLPFAVPYPNPINAFPILSVVVLSLVGESKINKPVVRVFDGDFRDRVGPFTKESFMH